MKIKPYMKKIIVIIIAIIAIAVCLSVVSADDYKNSPDTTSTTNTSDKLGCCSVVIQLKGNESVMSFRRDAKNEANINITEEKWHNTTILKQYKKEGGYFVQTIITEDGWIMGFGGIDDGIHNKQIENITSEIVSSKNISNGNLQKIQNIKQKFGLGHVVIKSPEGNYGIAMANTHIKGKLKEGDYLSIPNRYKYSRSGTIANQSADPVDSAIQLATSDAYGLSRRDIMTYHYKPIDNDTFKGHGIDIFASNDDGKQFSQHNAQNCDNFYYNNTFHDKKDIPIAPKKMYVGTHLFENHKTNNQLISVATLIISTILIVTISLKIIHNKNQRKKL